MADSSPRGEGRGEVIITGDVKTPENDDTSTLGLAGGGSWLCLGLKGLRCMVLTPLYPVGMGNLETRA